LAKETPTKFEGKNIRLVLPRQKITINGDYEGMATPVLVTNAMGQTKIIFRDAMILRGKTKKNWNEIYATENGIEKISKMKQVKIGNISSTMLLYAKVRIPNTTMPNGFEEREFQVESKIFGTNVYPK
jgi:hypothetical protein